MARTYKNFNYIKIESPCGEIIWSLTVGGEKIRFCTLKALKAYVDTLAQ